MSHNFQRFHYLLLACLMAGMADVAEAGSVQFSTYYPAPFGMYDRLRLVPRTGLTPPCDPGTMYINNEAGNQLEVCNAAGDDWAPLSGGPWTEDVNGVYVTDTTANVGIGTTAPASKLDVNGQTRMIKTCATDGDCGVGGTCSGGICSAGSNSGAIIYGNVGIGTATPRTKLELGDDGAILATGTFDSGWTEPNLGFGTRLLWYPRKGAFRAGGINGFGTEWNDANIGIYSVAMGLNTTASNNMSVALGYSTIASGPTSVAIGSGATASNTSSVALGLSATASGGASTAIGQQATASGVGSVALGTSAASGGRSTAMGYSTIASGDYSTAIGLSTTAQAYASTVLGRFNVGGGTLNSWVATDPLFVIGNGTDALNPSNAMTVLKNGNIGIGTTTPTSRLHVNAPQGDAPPGVFLENTDITVDGGADGQFALRNNSAGGTRKIFLGGAGAAYILTVDALTARVGIGTTSPQGGLHVLDFSPNGAVAGLLIERNSQSLGRTPRVVLVDTALGAVTAAPTWEIDNNLDQFRIFRQANISTAGPGVLSINNNGNVVIGTTAPGDVYKLEVTGGPIKATGGMILPTCTVAAGDCPGSPVDGQIWLCTDC